MGVTDLVWVEVLLTRGEMSSSLGPQRVSAWAGSLLYTIDVLDVTPFVELGLGRALLEVGTPIGRFTLAETTPVLGAGVDVELASWLWLGGAARYYPVLGTALFDSPGFSTFTARLSICTGCP